LTSIFIVRKQKVMLDRDLAQLYAVETKVLNQAVKRNIDRFPEDFMFQLTEEEWANLKSQIVTLNDDSLRSQSVTLENRRGRHRKYLPYAFTEQGVAMLSSVLTSQRAIAVNIHIMRVFVKMREIAANYSELMDKLTALQDSDSRQNEAINEIYRVIKELLEPEIKQRKKIGFKTGA